LQARKAQIMASRTFSSRAFDGFAIFSSPGTELVNSEHISGGGTVLHAESAAKAAMTISIFFIKAPNAFQ
jgi:hypothetical protein